MNLSDFTDTLRKQMKNNQRENYTQYIIRAALSIESTCFPLIN